MDTLLVATNSTELATYHEGLIGAVQDKCRRAMVRIREAEAMVEAAKRMKHSLTLPQRLLRQARAWNVYVSKILSALKAGYCMVPDMPGVVVAVRTARTTPSDRNKWERELHIGQEPCQSLSEGEGQYFAPTPTARAITVVPYCGKGETPHEETCYQADMLKSPDGLTLRFMRPKIIERTAEAMQHKFFDEIVMVGEGKVARPKPDPIIIGRIFDRTNHKVSSFMIVCFVDTSEI